MEHLSKEGKEEYRKILASVYSDTEIVLFEVTSEVVEYE